MHTTVMAHEDNGDRLKVQTIMGQAAVDIGDVTLFLQPDTSLSLATAILQYHGLKPPTVPVDDTTGGEAI